MAELKWKLSVTSRNVIVGHISHGPYLDVNVVFDPSEHYLPDHHAYHREAFFRKDQPPAAEAAAHSKSPRRYGLPWIAKPLNDYIDIVTVYRVYDDPVMPFRIGMDPEYGPPDASCTVKLTWEAEPFFHRLFQLFDQVYVPKR